MALLSRISSGLDWDKGTGEGAQQRTEMMLWSFVHGYATLKLAGQFRPREAGQIIPVEEVIPRFAYREGEA